MVVVTVEQGKLRGSEAVTASGFKYYEFLTVPYAKPPVGDLRFKSPQDPESWENERDATQSLVDNTSLQLNFLIGQFAGSEDCLYLNVYTPSLPSGNTKPLPVMVYIHGGGFIYGNGTLKEQIGPDFLLRNDVIVVTINYRLGVFGFLSLDIPEAAGNMGLKDQVKALKWVKNNIAKFNGDKDNITVFGISAGSASVEYLLLSPSANGLFHKAILQSGSSLNDWAMNLRYKELNNNLVKKLGFSGNLDDGPAMHKFLMTVPAQNLSECSFEVLEKYPAKSIFFGFVPIIEQDFDDAFLTRHPYELLKEGRFNKVPVMRGFCNKEGYIVAMKPGALNECVESKQFADFWNILEKEKLEYTSKFSAAYQRKSENEDKDAFAIDFFGDLHFSAGVWVSAQFQAKHGVPTHFYQFAFDGKLSMMLGTFGLVKKGAAHGDDMYYIFAGEGEMFKTEANEEDTKMRNKMTKIWTNYAKTSEPFSADQGLDWPKFTENNKSYLVIDKELSVASNYEPERMAVFEEIYDKIPIN